MKKKIITTITALSMTSFITPAMADGISDAFANTNQVRAGVYFRLPFTGGLKKPKEKGLNYGFSMGFSRTQASSNMMGPRQNFNADMIKFNFNTKGFNSFQMGGQDVVTYHNGQLGFLTNEDGTTNWKVMGAIMGGIVAVGVGVIIIKSSKCLEGEIKVNGKCVSPNPIT
jgi:hypothetical protein